MTPSPIWPSRTDSVELVAFESAATGHCAARAGGEHTGWDVSPAAVHHDHDVVHFGPNSLHGQTGQHFGACDASR